MVVSQDRTTDPAAHCTPSRYDFHQKHDSRASLRAMARLVGRSNGVRSVASLLPSVNKKSEYHSFDFRLFGADSVDIERNSLIIRESAFDSINPMPKPDVATGDRAHYVAGDIGHPLSKAGPARDLQ
jgi:hypothetical protein